MRTEVQESTPGEAPGPGTPRGRGLIDVVAHELRTPLAAILGYHELVADGVYGSLPPGANDALFRIGRSARHLLELVDGLELLEERPPELADRTTLVALPELLAEVEQTLRAEASARGMALHFTTDGAPITFRSDPHLLRRLLDLVGGALFKAASEGEYTLHAEARGGEVVLRLAGSPLDPSRDLPDAPADVCTGAGLRLLVARRLAARLRGTLTLAVGGVLTLTLPA